jgi:sec-independent protein translocase protein TatB
MFDIGFAELVIIAVVALLVIGPERLPDAVRTASAWVNRFRRGFNEIKQEVQQELHNDAVMRELRESGEKLRRETEALRQDLNASGSLPEPGTRVPPAAPPPVAEATPEQPDDSLASASDAVPAPAATDSKPSEPKTGPSPGSTSP